MDAVRLARLAPLCGALLLAGCAAHHARRVPAPAPPVSIESRPTPPLPESTAVREAPGATPSPRTTASLAAQAARDTAAAGARLRRCVGRRLLPDQQNTWDAAADLLAQTRAALLRGEVAKARSLAREARQLTGALYCP